MLSPARPARLRRSPLHAAWRALRRAGLYLPLVAHGQVALEGTVTTAGGGTLLRGDRPAYQETFGRKKNGSGGLENLVATRTSEASLFRLEARFLPGNDDYQLGLRYEKFDAWFVEASYQSFRTFYDGSGGRFLPRHLTLSHFPEALALDRSFFSLTLGTLSPDQIQWRLRYERATRDGTKSSTIWGDTNLVGPPYGTRNLVPSYLLVDEERDTVTAEASRTADDSRWQVTGRYERTSVNNRHVARRNPGEAADRFDLSQQGINADSVSGHAYYEKTFSENLRGSAGGLITSIDTHLAGSRVYGGSPDSPFSATFVRRQQDDNGYYGLVGHTRLKQYLANANLSYQATRYITAVAGLKYEHLRVDAFEDHLGTDTDLVRVPGGGGAVGRVLVTTSTATEANSRDAWNEVTEDLELRYTRWNRWNLSLRGQWNQGTGGLIEQSILTLNRNPVIDRDTDYERLGQRYSANATWYARPGLSLGAQYSYRLKIANFTARRDDTPNGAGSNNRYPSFIIDQDLASHDASLRLSWRPRATLTFATRYAYQLATVTTTFDTLPEIENGRLTRHVLTQTATWNATPRLYFTGAVNLTYDQLALPPHRLTFNSDNNYTSASVSAGYAAGKLTDLFLDLSHYRADNYTDNPAVTLPFNQGQTLQSAFVTWVRRQNERLVYTLKYGYATNRDGTFGGLNDFDAHLFYGKVQYKF